MISVNLMLDDDKTEFLIIGTRQQMAAAGRLTSIALGLGRLKFVL